MHRTSELSLTASVSSYSLYTGSSPDAGSLGDLAASTRQAFGLPYPLIPSAKSSENKQEYSGLFERAGYCLVHAHGATTFLRFLPFSVTQVRPDGCLHLFLVSLVVGVEK